MQKKDTSAADGKVSTRNKLPTFKCGDCLHFKVHAHGTKEKVCSAMGIRDVATAPQCFTPDVTKVTLTSDHLVQATSFYHALNPRARRIFIALMLQNSSRKFTFGAKIYFRAVGEDYIGNYLSGYCVGYSSTGELLVTGDPDRTRRGNSYTAMLTDDSVLDVAQFQKHRAALAAKGRFMDPKKPLLKFAPTNVLDDYEPPTLDTVSDKVAFKGSAKNPVKIDLDPLLAEDDQKKKKKKTSKVMKIRGASK